MVSEDNSDSMFANAIQYLIQRGQPTYGDDTGTANNTRQKTDMILYTRASGTFTFTLAPASGVAAGPKTILAGTFDVALTQ